VCRGGLHHGCRGAWRSVAAEDRLSRFNTGVPHPARIYDAWLGGKDNFAVDRAAAEAGLKLLPDTIRSVKANRAFPARTVEYLAAECGIRQFLDIGTGLPSANNTHEVAQAIAPNPGSSTSATTVASRAVHACVPRCSAGTRSHTG
jgi:hypothetical protein